MGSGLNRDAVIFAWNVGYQATVFIGDIRPEVMRIRRVQLI